MKYLIMLATAVIFASCGAATDSSTDAHQHDTPGTVSANAVVDPVCNMPKGDDWTEFSLNGSDTVWFCSPHCKESYDKDPAKYAKAE